MFYLQIDPSTDIAIAGVFTKEDNVIASDYVDFRPIVGTAGVGWLWNSITETWSTPPIVTISIEEIRIIRDIKLLESDWRVSVSDYPNSDIDAWIAYRNLLRDYPATYTPVENPIWPEAPS